MNNEPLESRIAPASLLLTDLDGDGVTFTDGGILHGIGTGSGTIV